MLPFRVFDRENKTTWTIINYHPGKPEGSYLAAREDHSPKDGELVLISESDLLKLRMLGFVEDQE